MAIFGAGSVWGVDEKIEDFFKDGNFVLGWNYENAIDLYMLISSVKVGDILYIKSKSPRFSNMTIKAIGIVTESLSYSLINTPKRYESVKEGGGLSIGVKWVIKTPFEIVIEENSGKLTSIRTSSFYEEFLPSIQNTIIEHLTSQL